MSLGKRALMLDFMAGKGRWSFDPQFHFDIETYKSWAFMLWGRYKIIQNKKLRMNVGFHPAFIFDKIQTIENGETKNIIRSNRYLAGEYAASYNITKNISIGPYSFIRERSNTRYTLYSFDEWIHKYYSLQRFLYGYQPATVLCKDG